MAKGIYIGDSNYKARKVKKIYIGDSNYKARKVKKVYIGDANGKARLCWTGVVPAGYVIFTTSQIWTVPDGIKNVHVFCVGGGGGGGNGGFYSGFSLGGGGGAGGYTKTWLNVPVTPNQQIAIVVGAGGAGGVKLDKTPKASDGGTSSFGSLIANGGGGGYNGSWDRTRDNKGAGGTGGSAGGSASTRRDWSFGSGITDMAGTGGGADGASTPNIHKVSGACIGQGTTTRSFGLSNGTLYAGGGGGGSGLYNTHFYAGGAGGGGNGGNQDVNTDGMPNTGGGGGGCGAYLNSSSMNTMHGSGRNGGSGLVIVKWDKQE